jgi:ubiquinone/menaquinone biosynthesis C-methylase UbiE
MSYKDKLSNYQWDCLVEVGCHSRFSDYIAEFSRTVSGKGVDIGAGPGGHNGQFFTHCKEIDGCDADIDVVSTLPTDTYSNTYQYFLGHQNLPYLESELDFVVCSCVIQHLNNFEELEKGIKEISRVLKSGGQFYLMFKAGSNDTTLTHFNSYYQQKRTFRVFSPSNIIDLCKSNNLTLSTVEKLVDDNWIPYCCLTFTKNY